MTANFSLNDFLGALLALIVLPLFGFIPGYTLGWLLNLAGFRERTPFLRVCLSLPLSIALTPALLYLIGRQFTVNAIWIFFAILAILFIWLVLRPSSRPFSGLWPVGIGRPLVLITLVGIFTPILSLIDLQIGHKLYFTIVSYDYSVRSAVISALARTPSYPPSNPFFFAGSPAPFRYHYFYFMLCSLPDRLATVLGHSVINPRHALIAGVIAISFALLATIILYLRLFSPLGARDIRRRAMIALVLLTISGLDILFCLGKVFSRTVLHKGNLYPTVDWWNDDQVTGWLDSTLWVPHHLAGMLACLMGFLIIWDHHRNRIGRFKWQVVLGAALCFAGASGLSVYVTFAFGGFLAVWFAIVLFSGRRQEAATLALVGLLAAVFALPFLLDLLRAGSAGTAAGEQSSFIRLGVRRFLPAQLALTSLHHDSRAVLRIANLISLPVNYFLEFGFFFVAAWLRIRQWRQRYAAFTPADFAAAVMLVSIFLICTFIRSNTISNNDLGMRGMLIAQFVLLLWSVDLLASMNLRHVGWLLSATFLLGAATNVYELITLRTFTVLADAGYDPGLNQFFKPNTGFGYRTFDCRQAYEWLDAHSSRKAVEQELPTGTKDFCSGLYSNRQISFPDYDIAVAFGAEPATAKHLQNAVQQTLISAPDPASICGTLPMDLVIVRDSSELWQHRSSWIWSKPTIFANPTVRAYACR